jgi:hypothetical protein
MTILYENEKVKVNYNRDIKLIEFIVLHPNITLDEKRKAWDETIVLMVSLKLNKILIDESIIEYSKINDLIYCNEGLVQLMARAIKSPKLYCAFATPITLHSKIDKETKFNQSFNQHNEIEYEFFMNKSDGIRWLISKPNSSSGFLTNFINSIFKSRKTTIEEEVESYKKSMGIVDQPFINQSIKEEIKKYKKENIK